VLRPGGRVAIADVVAEAEHTEPSDDSSWVDCISGALTEDEYQAALGAAGFLNTSIQRSHAVRDGFISVIVRASKPSSVGGRRPV